MFRINPLSTREEEELLPLNEELLQRIAHINALSLRFRTFMARRLEISEDEEIDQNNDNPHFFKEKDMNYKLYPLYINWKKIEANDLGYYQILTHYGYFGVAVYSFIKEKFLEINNKNYFFVFAEFIDEYLINDNINDKNKEIERKKISEIYYNKLPKIEEIYNLIKKKIILFKEIPVYLIVLKVLEIYFFLKKKENQKENEVIKEYNEMIIKVLKSEFLLISYLNENEYKEIFDNNFKGKTFNVFKKLCEKYGKLYDFPKTKERFFNHIKYLYKELNIINK